MTQKLDLKQLRAVAEAATPGPWTLEYDNADDWESGIDDGDYPYALHGPRNCSFDNWADKRSVQDDLNRVTEISEMVDADAEFIATFDPSTVLALLSRLEQAERELVAVKSTQVQHIVKTSFETARTAGIALDEAVKVVAGWLANDPDRRAREAEQQVARVREALSNHPRTCDQHTEDDPVKCGWKRAVIDVQNALDGEQDA